MFKLLKIYLVCTILFTTAYSSAYKTLILLEFENISHNLPEDHLRGELPNLVKDFSQEFFDIEYAGKIEPYLGINNTKYDDAIILLGKFSIHKGIIDISISIYDVVSWNRITDNTYQCKLSNSSCIENNLNTVLENILLPLSVSKESVVGKNVYNYSNAETDYDSNNLNEVLNSFAIEVDLIDSWKKLYKDGNQYGSRYYQDIDYKTKKEFLNNSKEKNTETLVNYINDILLNPYDVSIENISMRYNQLDDNYLDLTIPVSYNIKKSLIEDMLTTLPHESKSSQNGSLIIKFSKSDFIFSDSIIDKFALMKHQVVPVLFLTNTYGKPNYIYVDSEKMKELNKRGRIEVKKSEDEFYPLYAITPGKNNMQINLDLETLNIIYDFTIKVEEIEQYSKIAIKFLYENEIKELLDQFYSLKN